MARHKMGTSKNKKTTGAKRSTRRRRIGASGKIEPVAMNILAGGVGLVAMNEIAIIAGGMFPGLMATPVYTGLAEIAIGVITAWKAKNGFLRFAGIGAGANGIYTTLKGFGVIGAGPQTMSYQYQNRRMMGDPRIKFVAGPTTRIGEAVGAYPNNFSMVAGPGVGARKKRYTS